MNQTSLEEPDQRPAQVLGLESAFTPTVSQCAASVNLRFHGQFGALRPDWAPNSTPGGKST